MIVGLLEKPWLVSYAATYGTEPDVVKRLAEGKCLGLRKARVVRAILCLKTRAF